jgi:hypothetical protein
MIAGLTYAALSVARALLPSLELVDPQLLAAIIAAVGTVLAAVGTVVYSQARTKQLEIAEAHRPRKVEVYSNFMTALVELLRRTKRGQLEGITEDEEFVERFYVFKRDLIVWGAPGVIKAYRRFELGANEGSARKRILRIDTILREIRKDLGNKTWTLPRGALIQMFLTDPIEKIGEGEIKDDD